MMTGGERMYMRGGCLACTYLSLVWEDWLVSRHYLYAGCLL